METWRATSICFIRFTCGLILFPFLVIEPWGEKKHRWLAACLNAWYDFCSLSQVHVLILFDLQKIQNLFAVSLCFSWQKSSGWASGVPGRWTYTVYWTSCSTLVVMKISWQTINSFLPSSPSVEALKVIRKVAFSWLNLGLMANRVCCSAVSNR